MKAMLIFLVLMLVVGGALTYHVRKQNREARYEAYVFQGYRTGVESNHEVIVRTTAACRRILENAERLLPTVSGLVAETLKIEAQSIPGVEVANEAVVAAAPAALSPPPGGGAKGNLAAGEAPAPIPAPTVAPRPRAERVEEEEGKPDGIMGRKELDAMRERAAKGIPEREESMPVVVPDSVKPPPPSPRPVAPAVRPAVKKAERPIQILGRQVEGHVQRVREVVQSIMEIEAESQALLGEVMNSRTSVVAGEKLAAIGPLVTTASVFHAECAVELELARNGIQPMELEKNKAQAEYRQKLEEARRRKEEADRNALIAREVAAAGALAKELAGMIRQFQFVEAHARAIVEMEQCKSDEGKAAHSVLVDRCGRLKAFKVYVIKRLSEKPYRWGWVDQAGARDILTADEDGVKHATGKVAWPDIGMKQLVKIVDYVLSDTSPGVKVMGDCHLGAAILFKDLGAAEMAEGHRSKAVFNMPYIENEAALLLR